MATINIGPCECCGGLIDTECCDAVPATLTVIATNHGVTREFTITYDAGLEQWQGAEGALDAPGLGAIMGKTHDVFEHCLFFFTCYGAGLGIRTSGLGFRWSTYEPAKTDLMTGFGSYLKAATCNPFYLKFERTDHTVWPFNGDCDDVDNYETIDLVLEIME